jgi:urocanate hydratase
MVETELFFKTGHNTINNEIPVRNDRRANIDHVRPSNGIVSSHKEAPRVVVTNGMVTLIILNRMIGKNECLRRITIMTAGSYMYIGPQGIVHGTTITAFRKINRSPSGGLFLLQG